MGKELDILVFQTLHSILIIPFQFIRIKMQLVIKLLKDHLNQLKVSHLQLAIS